MESEVVLNSQLAETAAMKMIFSSAGRFTSTTFLRLLTRPRIKILAEEFSRRIS